MTTSRQAFPALICRSFHVFLLGVSTFLASCSSAPPTNQTTDRAAWMQAAHWGVMTHYLADWRAQADHEPASVEHWNELVDHFDVEGLADQLQSIGVGYYLITIGQNSGYYLSPNAT